MMKKRAIDLIAILLTVFMLCGIFAACGNKAEGAPQATSDTTEQTDTSSETTVEIKNDETVTDDNREDSDTQESAPQESQESTEADTTLTTESTETTESETATTAESTEETSVETITPASGSYGEQITHASSLANGVNAHYADASSNAFVLENQNAILNYALKGSDGKLVTSLQNHNGNSYIENTMDVFVRMQDGNTYYASASASDASANLYRMGYYYYEARFEGQGFIKEYIVTSKEDVKLQVGSANSFSKHQVKSNGEFVGVIGNTFDPYVAFGGIEVPADGATHFRISIKVDPTVSSNAGIYFMAGSYTQFSSHQLLSFDITNDGEYHTYDIPLRDVNDFTNTLRAFRLDFEGSVGSKIYLKDAQLISLASDGAPDGLSINRSFLVYSDKLHQQVQFATTGEVSGIECFGISTKIAIDKVEKIIIEDKNGTHTSFDGVDWTRVKYIGFDIKDAGIYGIIMPFDGRGGSLSVTAVDGFYLIEQTAIPEGNKLSPSKPSTGNANDFFMGSRIYTDTNHTFDAFVYEAERERSPYTASNFTVDTENSDSASFLGYDSLRGVYKFRVAASSFNEAYYNSPNKHIRLSVRVKGHDDRTIYIMTVANTGGIECAAILSDNGMMLPFPIEVMKNFCEGKSGEMNLYNLDDAVYSEALLPLYVKKGDAKTYTILNLYQNWGKYPLKQISSIQFYAPYYHLSTGVSESNCIVPMGNNTLPDFRSMSSPLWSNQPQHSSCGTHTWLNYTDAEGNYVTTFNTKNTIGSFGPTYADVTMENMSSDGKIKVTYTHMEMPQVDENRTYYEITYEILDDVSFKDFKNDFTFYTVSGNDPSGRYTQFGYLDQNNQSRVTAAAEGKESSYVLGDECPYFSFFNMENWSSQSQQGYANVALLIYNSSFTIGGEECSPSFIARNAPLSVSLSLNLDEITLKKGDRFTINMILLPWGSQNSDYSGTSPDKNVRDVRENTLLNPASATPVSDCEAIESVYVPKIKTTNGKSATFTVSGGENNIAIRAYGFEKLTSPVIEELIGGEWVKVDVSSASTPDKLGNAHYYDGYCVYYDGDGTYSYSFVATMDKGQARTLRITADEDFKAWPEEDAVESADPLNFYLDAQDIASAAQKSGMFGATEIIDDEYVRIYGNGSAAEAYFLARRSDDGAVTGQYIVLKYRVPKEYENSFGNMEFFTSTQNLDVVASENIRLSHVSQNGEWAVLIIDAASRGIPSFTQNPDGEYAVTALRYDVFNAVVSTDAYIEIAYIGISDSLEKIYALNNDMQQIFLVRAGGVATPIDPSTGREIGADEEKVYVDPSSGYTESDNMYSAWIDMINGVGPNGNATYTGIGGDSWNGMDTVALNSTTVNGSHLVFSGWTVAEGGIEKYVWSADGGKTWHDATLYNLAAIKSGGDAHLDTALSVAGITDYVYNDRASSTANAAYQGATGLGDKVSGLSADLSAYAGQTVCVTFAAVPKNAPDTLCLILHVTGVEVK